MSLVQNPLWIFVGLFSTVCFQMVPQKMCTRGCKVTLVAFVGLFPIVGSQMSPQIAYLGGCKITLVAFVWFFSTVRFQMSPQIACLRRFILTLVALFWLHVLTILCHILRSFFVDTLKFFIHNLWEEMGDTWPPRFALSTDILWRLFTQQKKRESVLSVFLNTKKRESMHCREGRCFYYKLQAIS